MPKQVDQRQDGPSANRLVPGYPVNMTRTEAAATAMALDLTDAERAAIECSKEDFKAGRTYSNDQYHAEMTAFMADLKSKHP
jgi:hypothetical protein